MALLYPAQVTEQGGVFLVTFRDVPEASTSGSSPDDALAMAAKALVAAMDCYIEQRRSVRAPSALLAGEVLVELPADVEAAVLLLNEIVATGTAAPSV